MRNYNPLLTPAVYKRLYHYHGFVDPLRGSGRTTAIALRVISTAIANPGIPQELRDHHGAQKANKDLADKARNMLEALGLSHHTQVVTINCDPGKAVLFGVDMTGRQTLRPESVRVPALSDKEEDLS